MPKKHNLDVYQDIQLVFGEHKETDSLIEICRICDSVITELTERNKDRAKLNSGTV